MKVIIRDLQTRLEVDRAHVRAAARAALGTDRSVPILAMVFVDDAGIREVNRRFLGRDRYTDVIAFDYRGGPRAGETEAGEIVISVDRAMVQARRRGLPVERELLLYVIHGVLHLRGYDDLEPERARLMRKEQNKVLNSIAHLWKR